MTAAIRSVRKPRMGSSNFNLDTINRDGHQVAILANLTGHQSETPQPTSTDSTIRPAVAIKVEAQRAWTATVVDGGNDSAPAVLHNVRALGASEMPYSQ